MNCNCIVELKERIKTELPTKVAKYKSLKITNITIGGECFLYGENTMTTGLSITATLTHEQGGRKKTSKIDFVARYCPFCGEEFELITEQPIIDAQKMKRCSEERL